MIPGNNFLEWREATAEALAFQGFSAARVRSFRNCGLNIRELVCCHCGNAERRPLSCDLRVCPICAKGQARRVFHRYAPALRFASGHGYRLKLITLTVRKTTVEADVARISKLIPRFVDAALRCPGFGALFALEVGPSGNVHAHGVYFGPYQDQGALSRTWFDLTGDSPIVDIRAWRGKRLGALREALKYAIKAGAVEPILAATAEVAMKGRRRVRSYGLFFGVSAGDPPLLECAVCGASEWDLRERFEHRIRHGFDVCA